MVASHDGRWVYASCTRDNVVRKIDVASLSVVDSTNMLTQQDLAEGRTCYPAGLALSAVDSKLYVACHRHAEIRVVTTTPLGAITNAIPTGDGPYLIRLDPDGRRLWVPNRNDGSFTVIDLADERPIATRQASASHPHTFAFGPDGTAYLSMESRGVVPGAIDVIDPATLEIRRSIEVGLQATGVGVIR
jgi:DNA-binding beta-propeller fold protein YncE